MGRIVNFEAKLTATNLMRAMQRHQDVSEGSQSKLFAVRTLLGRTVRFYTSGEHLTDAFEGTLTELEQYESQIMRFAHASLLSGQVEGDKRMLAVDATCDPCKVWTMGMPWEEFIRKAQLAKLAGLLTNEIIVDSFSTALPIIRNYKHVEPI